MMGSLCLTPPYMTARMKELGITVLRFMDRDVMNNIEYVMERVKDVIGELEGDPPNPSF